MLSLSQLAAYVAVIETGTFQAAAERLQVSQPTVSQSVRNLEARFGVPLVARSRVQCEPTAAGAKLLRHAKVLTRLAAEVEDAMLRERVSIGASSNVGTYVLQPFVKRFVDQSNSPRIDISIANNRDVATALTEGELDVAVMEWWDGRPGFAATAWSEEELVVIVDNNHPWCHRDVITRDELFSMTMIGGESGSGTATLLQQVFGSSSKDLKVSYTMGSTEAVKSAVRAGLGASLVLAAAVRDEVRNRTLHALRVEGFPIAKRLQIVLPADSPPTSSAVKFAELLMGERT